jgi:hypothetical protein
MRNYNGLGSQVSGLRVSESQVSESQVMTSIQKFEDLEAWRLRH